jgi:HEAT repeat protein
MQFLGHDDPRVTANIVEALGGARSTPELKDFFWAAAGSPNGRVAGNAVIGLFQIGEPGAADVLRRLCRHEAPSVRASAAWVIGTVGWIEGMDVALEMTRDPNPKVQRDALQAVRRLQSLAGSSGTKVLNAGGGYR